MKLMPTNDIVGTMQAIAENLSDDVDILQMERDYWHESVVDSLGDCEYRRAQVELDKLCALDSIATQVEVIRSMFPKNEKDEEQCSRDHERFRLIKYRCCWGSST